MLSLFPDRVGDLIDPNTRTWRVDMINETFWPVDRARILAIPMGALDVEDRRVWHFSKDGKFSVKSCYQFIHSYTAASRGTSLSSGSGTKAMGWNSIWQLKLPPKVRMFLWRTCSNILPTKIELYRRHVAGNPFCERCGEKAESIAHSLFECPGFRELWNEEPFKIGSIDTQCSMWAILEVLRRSLSAELFLDAMVLCWKLWEIRNNELHGSLDDSPGDSVAWASDFRAIYLAAQLGDAVERDNIVAVQWRPPDPGTIKINVDLALPTGHDFIQIGMVARDSNGRVVWWLVKKVAGRPAPMDGEAMAVYHGVLLARNKDWSRVIVETDCLHVFRSISLSSSSHSFLSFGALIDSCLAFRRFFQSLSFSFTRRSGNFLAHSLAIDLVIPCNVGDSLPSLLS